jgi:hypothetical protein
MASSLLKRPCSKCNKGSGILTCDGCQQTFCAKHITDHRQDLSIQMDNIGQEYDLLRRDLIRDDTEPHPLLHRINLWEQESITKIQQIAQQVRNDLQQSLVENKNQTKNLCTKLSDDLYSCRESGDYTEIDFKSWTEQLTELRKTLEKQPIIDLIHDNKTFVPIHTIKIKEKTDAHISRANSQSFDHNILTSRLSTFPENERFNKFIGDATFSDDYLVARHSDDSQRSIMVYITPSYSSGTHRIRFRIEQKTNKYLFVGIINSLEEMSRNIFNSPSLYGWMTPAMRVIKSRKISPANLDGRFNEGDEILLTLNLNIQQISLEHPQTNTIDRLPIDCRSCPFPWRVVVAFFNQDDSVRIIR